MLHSPFNSYKIDSTEFTTIHTHYNEFYSRSKALISRIANGKFLEKHGNDTEQHTNSSISSDMNIHITIPGTFYLVGNFLIITIISFIILNITTSYIFMFCRICWYYHIY
jgi:hypothetical protein